MESKVELSHSKRHDADGGRHRFLWRHGRKLLRARRRKWAQIMGPEPPRRDWWRRHHLFGQRDAKDRRCKRSHRNSVADRNHNGQGVNTWIGVGRRSPSSPWSIVRDLRANRGRKPEKARAVPLSALRKLRYATTSSSRGACPSAKEHDMREPPTSATDAAPAEDLPIRERVKELTSQVLQQGRVDPDAFREVANAVLGRTPGSTPATGAKTREFFAEEVRRLDDVLLKSASATHGALQQLASRGQDFSDNDLKQALVSLRKLEEDHVAVSNRLAEAMSANLRREMTEIATHAQNLGVEASVRVANMMGEFA